MGALMRCPCLGKPAEDHSVIEMFQNFHKKSSFIQIFCYFRIWLIFHICFSGFLKFLFTFREHLAKSSNIKKIAFIFGPWAKLRETGEFSAIYVN